MTGRRRLRRMAGPGVLPVIAGLFIASALLRLGEGIGGALARDDAAPAVLQVAAPADPQAPPRETAQVLAALAEREARLREREEALAARLQALAAAEARLQDQIAALEAAETALADTVAIADRAAERDLAHLTAVYEGMKPKEAAALFEEMDAGFAAGFLGRMQPDAAAAIMAGLAPRTAYALSVILAGRNAGAPRE